MNRLATIALMLATLPALAGDFPIENGELRTDLDANGYKVTGAADGTATNHLATVGQVASTFITVPSTVISSAILTVTNNYLIFTSGICTVALPAVSSGRTVSIIKRDATNTLTITGTIESDTNGASITDRWSGDFVSDGVEWWIR